MTRTPSELQQDESFRAELRQALQNPALQIALGSLRFHRGLLRLSSAASPSAVVYHTAVWTGGYNSALDELERLTEVPKPKAENSLPYDHIQPEEL